MKVIKYNIPLACIALVAVILFTLTFGVGRTVNGCYKDLTALYQSTKASADIKDLQGYSAMIMSGAKSAGADVSALEAALSELGKVDTDPTRIEDSIDNVMTQTSLAYSYVDGDTAMIAHMREVQSVMMRLKNNEQYNNAAAKYNKVIHSFPASLFSIGKGDAVNFS